MVTEKTRRKLNNALKAGGEILMQYHGRVMETRVKESISSVVTDADHVSEKEILLALDDPSDRYNIISEEAGFADRNAEYTWVVDPLDGTSNFAAGLPWFGIIIALFHRGRPLLAGMYLPAEGQTYLAEKGKGVSRNGQRIETTRSDALNQHLISYSFDYQTDPEKTKAEMRLMATLSRHVRNIRSTNSLYDFCYVADGRLGAAINQTTRIWDIAAPSLIISEAGGRVSDLEGAEIVFDLGAGCLDRNYGIVAAGSGIYHEIIDICSSK